MKGLPAETASRNFCFLFSSSGLAGSVEGDEIVLVENRRRRRRRLGCHSTSKPYFLPSSVNIFSEKAKRLVTAIDDRMKRTRRFWCEVVGFLAFS